MWKELQTLKPLITKHWWRYTFGLLFLITIDYAQTEIPQFIKKIVDTILAGVDETVLHTNLVFMLLTAAGIAIGRFMWRFFIHGASRRIERDLRARLFEHYMALPMKAFQDNPTGELMARATNDMQAIRMLTGMAIVAFIDGFFMSAIVLARMFTENPSVALRVILPLPIVTLIIILFGRKIGKRFKKIQEIYGTMSTLVQEVLQGIRVVKAFVKEDIFKNRFENENDSYRKANMSLVLLFGFFFPLINFIAGITMLILFITGGNAILENSMSAGTLTAMIAYLEMLLWPMIGAGFTVNTIQRGLASLKRINEILFLPQEEKTRNNTSGIKIPERGDFVFNNLTFTYPGAQKPALNAVSFTISYGKTFGILGRIGSGKSTLLKLMTRILEPEPNQILYGNADITSIDINELRKLFGYVPQESFLFSDSIKNNILFANPDLSDDELENIIQIAGLEPDLALFPHGIETVVGEKGLTLSGGQKQRVSIARALAVNPEILVFDDALSAVDTETEEKILKALCKLRRGKTNIIVSNRVSTLQNADCIGVFSHGELIQLGTPEELLNQEGFFAEIALMQSLSKEKDS